MTRNVISESLSVNWLFHIFGVGGFYKAHRQEKSQSEQQDVSTCLGRHIDAITDMSQSSREAVPWQAAQCGRTGQ